MSFCCMDGLDSFAAIHSEVLAKKCQEVISRIAQQREEENVEIIESNRRKRVLFFFGRKETNEEVVIRLKSVDFFPVYPSILGWGAKDTAERLLRLSKLSKRVFVSSADAADIDL